MTYFDDAEIHAATIARLPSLSPVRAAIVADVLALDGLEPSSARYRDELYPADHPSRRPALAAGQSSCGIVVEHGWRAAQIDAPEIYGSYDSRGARGGIVAPLTYSVHLARAEGCWRQPDVKTGALPLEGDAVCVGDPSGAGGTPGVWAKGGGFGGAHICTVVATSYAVSSAAAIVHSVDGGQPGIHVRTRALVWCGPGGAELWAASLDDEGGYTLDADGRPTKGRRVFGWVDVDGLPLRRAALAEALRGA